MYVLFIILNNEDYLEDILRKFVDLEIKGATILDSQGMASAIVNGRIDNIPLFGSLKTLLEGARPYNKTIFTVIDSEEQVEQTVNAIRYILRYESKNVGFMFTIPIGKVYSMKNNDYEF